MNGARPARSDHGFTLVEVLIVMMILGIVVTSIAAAFSVIVRATPATEVRVSDARSTRGLATWLSHDTTSAPRFAPSTAQGGIGVHPSNDDCLVGGSANTNVLHLSWNENGFSNRTWVANYRYVVDGDEARIVRYTCSRSGSGPFTGAEALNLTAGLNPSTPPVVVLNPGSDPTLVESIDFLLTATSGETVLVQTGSRNAAEFFPT